MPEGDQPWACARLNLECELIHWVLSPPNLSGVMVPGRITLLIVCEVTVESPSKIVKDIVDTIERRLRDALKYKGTIICVWNMEVKMVYRNG